MTERAVAAGPASVEAGAFLPNCSGLPAHLRIDIPRKGAPDIGALCREAVERGDPDQPVEVWLDGKHCLNIRSLHSFALRSIVEEPGLRIVDWKPHPKAVIGPRVRALLTDRILRKEYGA